MAEETKIGMKLDMELEPIKDMCKKLEDAIKHEFSKGIENIDTMEMKEAVDMLKDLYEAKEKIVKACYYKGVLEAMEEHDFEDEDEIEDTGREADKNKKGYRSRDSRGRFTSRRNRRGYESPMMMYDDNWNEMESMRDMDRPMGRMGYSGGSSSSGMSSGQSSSGMSGGQSSGMSNNGSSRGYEENRGGQYSSRMQRDSREGRSGEARRGYMESKEMHKDNSTESKQHKMRELENYMKELSSDVTEMIEGASPEEKNMLKNKMQVLMQKIQ